MHESQILDLVDSLTVDALSLDEKAIIVADVKSELLEPDWREMFLH